MYILFGTRGRNIHRCDFLVISKNKKLTKEFENYLSQTFEIKSLDDVKYCLEIEFSGTDVGIKINQKGYVKDDDRFGKADSKQVSTQSTWETD